MKWLLVKRLSWLVVGLLLYGTSLAMMVRASIGVGPWDVLSQGLSRTTGISFGMMTNLIGLGVLLLWVPLRQRPGIGTVLNVLLIGSAADVALAVIPEPGMLLLRGLLFAGGLLLLACATGIYLAPALGPGPRDGVMTGLHARTRAPIWLVRGGIEVTVLVAGWLLGGQVGVGTLAEALLIGPLVHRTLPFFRTVHAGVPGFGRPRPGAAPAGGPARSAELPPSACG